MWKYADLLKTIEKRSLVMNSLLIWLSQSCAARVSYLRITELIFDQSCPLFCMKYSWIWLILVLVKCWISQRFNNATIIKIHNDFIYFADRFWPRLPLTKWQNNTQQNSFTLHCKKINRFRAARTLSWPDFDSSIQNKKRHFAARVKNIRNN